MSLQVTSSTETITNPDQITNTPDTKSVISNSSGMQDEDWFEFIDTVDIKDSRLINIDKLIDIDTIGLTDKYAIHDIRGLEKAICPKFVISPWLQSSWKSETTLDQMPGTTEKENKENTNDAQINKSIDIQYPSIEYTNKSNGSDKDKNKNNSSAYIPQEQEKDWFESIEISDKNSRTINVHRPVGLNTVDSTFKDTSYDIRKIDKNICPKFVVSPWLQSSWEPDKSSKSICF